MHRMIAFLRGINISGKNKVPMGELKAAAAALGYANVQTLLNSGNVLFSAENVTETAHAERIRTMLKETFAVDTPVYVIRQERLIELLSQAPEWWGTDRKEIYDNLIFVLPPADARAVAERIGAPSEGLEQIQICENVIFWSFDRKRYAKANWWKQTARAGIAELLTIRTANTLRKLAAMRQTTEN